MLNLNATFNDSITAATGAAIQQFSAVLTKKLCHSVCKNQAIQPSFEIDYSLGDIKNIGTTTFVEVIANGRIVYVPKGSCECSAKTELFTERQTLMFSNTAATSAPTVTIAQGASIGDLTDLKCTTSNQYLIATNVTVTATYA